MTATALATAAPTTWLVDWSDTEHEAFLRARAGLDPLPRVVRAAPLQLDVGGARYRWRSKLRFTRLAAQGRLLGPGPVVHWQGAAGMLASLLPAGRRGPSLVMNPLLRDDADGWRERIGRAGLRRSDHVITYSTVAAEALHRMGVPADRLHVVLLGVEAAAERAGEPGDYVLAAGYSHRDWDTLSRAARQVDVEVRVLGPSTLTRLDGCTVEPTQGKEIFARLLRGAQALVVPLKDASMPAGTLALLNALSLGIPVIATSGPGTDDYLSDRWSRGTPAGDAAALAAAIREVCDPAVRARLADGAWQAGQERFSLPAFVRRVEGIAHAMEDQ